VQRNFLVVLLVVVLGGLATAAWWLSGRKPEVPVPLPVPADVSTPAPAVEPTTRMDPVVRQPDDDPAAMESLDTTVAFPLEVELELLLANEAPRAPGVSPLGTGSNAQLKGQIMGPNNQGVRAEIEFLAGTNQGRVLYCDASGAFGATNLQPGLCVARVSGPGIVGAVREVRLRQQRESLLNVSFSRPARVSGTVFDHEGKPLPAAAVTFDGQRVLTDDMGVFELPAVAGGEALVVVEKPGFAAVRQNVTVQMAGKIEKDKLQFRLRRSARLQVEVVEALNASEQAWLYVLPADAAAQRLFPWQNASPVRVWPGGTATIEDLPSGTATVLLFHSGAVAKPTQAVALLTAGETTTMQFHLEPAPVVQGVVTDQGKVAAGARVRLEAPDRTQANLSVFGQTNYLYLESDVFPNLPPAMQEATTNERGEFSLTANESVSGVRYLTAISKDGRRLAHAVVKPGTLRVDLVLEPIVQGASELRFVMPGRFQPLPVKIAINGEPRESQMLPPGRDLRVESLPSGSWLATVSWQGQKLMDRVPLELDGELVRDLKLPEGAIVGQDAETWLRVKR